MSLSIKLLDSIIEKLTEEKPINDYIDLKKDRKYFYNQTEEEAYRHYKSNGEGSRNDY